MSTSRNSLHHYGPATSYASFVNAPIDRDFARMQAELAGISGNSTSPRRHRIGHALSRLVHPHRAA